ncbi:FlgO family outer membrane protein [Sulfitobacter dubius]|uniref:FlgO family outer membrane protein n=1 Tax=Sulfitobacter dubius TaxID=218673 RepID=UPI0022AEAFD2|nr:FlgO family outer membrane protein [Sulfitobacter dubius]MCZ4368682.1 FlgO family outer membrane protein [Sulfitobacter dubius]
MKLLEGSRAILLLVAIALPISASSQSIDEAIGSLAKKLGTQLGEEGTERLAIYGFSDLNGFESALGDFISEELTTSLFGAGDFDIVERNEFERVLREHERYASDIFNSETIADLGEFLAIEALITGSITQFEDSVRINARAIDVETARVFAAASISATRDSMVDSLTNQRSRANSDALNAVPGVIAQQADVGFQDSRLRMDITSVLLWENREGVTVTTELHNMTNERIYVTAGSRQGRDLYATTKHGDNFRSVTLSQSIYQFVNDPETDEVTTLDPNRPLTIVWKASKRGQPIVGNRLVLQGIFYTLINGSFERSQIILDNISLE